MAQQFRGRPFGDFVLHHADGMHVDALRATLLGFVTLLPKRLHAEVAEWLQLNLSQGSPETLLNTDCGDAFLAIVERSRAFVARHSVEPGNDTLINLFQIVALNFAILASSNAAEKTSWSPFGGGSFLKRMFRS